MKTRSVLAAFVAALCFLSVSAQPPRPKKTEPVLTKISNKDVVQSVFSEATMVERVNDYWFKIVDDKNKLFGYAMTSTDYCKNVQGYNNTTPVMIITDKKFVIKKVAMLSNYETLGYVRRLEKMGFFTNWNDLKLAKAQNIKVDAYAGATITARAIENNVNFLVQNGGKKLPKN